MMESWKHGLEGHHLATRSSSSSLRNVEGDVSIADLVQRLMMLRKARVLAVEEKDGYGYGGGDDEDEAEDEEEREALYVRDYDAFLGEATTDFVDGW